MSEENDKPKLKLVPTDPVTRPDPKKPNIEKMRLWNRGDAGQWAMSREGIAGTYFAAAEDIETLLERFDAGIKVVGKEVGLDFDDFFASWVENDCMLSDEEGAKVLGEMERKLNDVFARQTKYEDFARIVDACDLYQHVHFARHAIAEEDAKGAAWMAALAAEAAVRMKGRSAEALLQAGYKHSVVAPAKKTEWHGLLVKAARRALKAGTPERKLVGLMHEQFNDHSMDAIRRALKKHKVLT